MIIIEGEKETKTSQAKKQKKPQPKLSNKKLCPRCGKPGSGPYSRWVRNGRGKRYEPYFYFAHREGGKLRWCYLGKRKVLDNREQPLDSTLSNTKMLEASA